MSASSARDPGSTSSSRPTQGTPSPPDAPTGVDDESAFRGAWIEFRTSDVDAVHAALREAGVPESLHPGSHHVYFSAPGGQEFRLLDVGYTGP